MFGCKGPFEDVRVGTERDGFNELRCSVCGKIEMRY